MLFIMVKKLFLFLIKVYQKIISPSQGIFKGARPYYGCRFYPSCSNYAYQAIERYGAIKGSIRGIKRITKCHPWSEGGWDPLEYQKSKTCGERSLTIKNQKPE